MTYKQFYELKREFYTLTPGRYTIAELDAIRSIIQELAKTDKSDTSDTFMLSWLSIKK